VRLRSDGTSLQKQPPNTSQAASQVPSKLSVSSAGQAKKVQSTMRHFQFIGGNSAKFWEIETNGLEVKVRYGRLGTKGQISDKSFPDEAAAQKHAEKLIQEKTSKGYVEHAAVN
jgi:predicted DNA-binding WGR domain protein